MSSANMGSIKRQRQTVLILRIVLALIALSYALFLRCGSPASVNLSNSLVNQSQIPANATFENYRNLFDPRVMLFRIGWSTR
ncbi:MAG: hypothetical protein R2873_16880 [Caldilineaceae bacterium]